MSVYNDAGRIESSVGSILGQSFHDLELIVIDDGSTDGCSQLLDGLASEDPRLRILHQENTGLTRALIHGCAEARGEFIARQDSDDWSHLLRIAEQVALFDKDPRLGFVSCTTECVGPGGEHMSFTERPADPEVATHGLLHNRQGPPAHGSVMFRKALYEKVGGYREEFYYSQDSDLWLRMGEQALIGYIPNVRYRYIKEPGSISGVGRPRQLEFARLVHACRVCRVSGTSESECLDEARKLMENIRSERLGSQISGIDKSPEITYLIGSQLVKNGDRRAIGYLRQVITARPMHWRAWVRLVQAILITSEEKRDDG